MLLYSLIFFHSVQRKPRQKTCILGPWPHFPNLNSRWSNSLPGHHPSHHLCLQIWLQSLAKLQWTKQNAKSSKLYQVLLTYVPGQTIFLGSKITANGDCSHKIKTLAPWKKRYDNPRQHTKKQRHYFADKSPYHQTYAFSSTHVGMWELNHKEGWTLKNWCSWAVVLEKTLKSPLVGRRLNQSILKKVNPEYSLKGLMLKLKLQYFGHLMWRADSIRKDPDAGKDWRQEEKGMTEDEMVGWHHWLKRHELEKALGNGEGQRSLACCNPWGHKESDDEWLNNKSQALRGRSVW